MSVLLDVHLVNVANHFSYQVNLGSILGSIIKVSLTHQQLTHTFFVLINRDVFVLVYPCSHADCSAIFSKWTELRKHSKTHPKGEFYC